MSLCFCSRPSSPTVMRMHQWRIQAITNVLSTLDGGGRDASQGGSNLRSKVASVRQSCTGCARRGKGYDTYKPTKGCHCRDIPYTYDVSYSYNTIYHMTSSQINDTFLFHHVIKILTDGRILQISIARCQIDGAQQSLTTPKK